jgi:FMN phosphatase YigB (HAD superfamily)
MQSLAFLLDVDNTLLNNDDVSRDLRAHLDHTFGAERGESYWRLFEELRSQLGYADYLGALQRYRLERPDDPRILQMSSFLIDYPFQDRVYPGAVEAVERIKHFGPCVILSDGDAVFQPRKIERSGLWAAVDGNVLVYVHKEQMLDDVERQYPANHYVMVDDKLRILAAMKKVWGSRLTTVWVVQGHYATDPNVTRQYPMADVRIEAIGDLAKLDEARFHVGE